MIVATVLLSITMLTPAFSTNEDFSIFNSGWNGTSALAVTTFQSGRFAPSFVMSATGTDMEVVQLGFDKIELDPASSTLAVIGPNRGFTSDEGRIVGDFVRGGGVLLLADDFGTGNELLTAMGSASRISGKLVMDLAFDKKPEFSVCFDLRSDPLTRNVSSLLLNYPSSISVNTATTKAVAFTSIASWQDSNGNKVRDQEEPEGPFTVVAREELGNGTVIIVSDPSLLINGMAKYLNNSALDENIISEICTGRTSVYFDESHRNFFNPVAVTLNFSASVSDQAKALLAILAFILILWLATDYLDIAFGFAVQRANMIYAVTMRALLGWTKKAPAAGLPESGQLEREVMDRHPEWRPGMLRYVAKEHERHSAAASTGEK